MFARRRAWTLATCLLAAAPVCVQADATGQLARYVAVPDASYTWHEVKASRLGKTQLTELVLTSQTWRGIAWKHQLVILRPATLEPSSSQAFLFVHGGRWKPEYETGQAQLPREARIFANLAETLRAPVAVLRHVPFQPLFDRREDALIAYTFDHYLESGEADWPLLLPMVKSAARAMDAVQAFARERWQHPVVAFTVAGASKRGWTSWLTAAVDARVASVAPIAIDMLNVPAQIELQRATFGALSDQVQDYIDIDLPGRVDSERGRSLLAMVDPYSYRADLVRPKLILLGTNDRYWPLDALKVYWSDLPEPKRVLYVPNQGHGVRDLDRLVGGLSALHRYSSHGERLPSVSGNYAVRPERIGIDVRTDRVPRQVFAWVASSATRDFREARWTSHRCRKTGSEPNFGAAGGGPSRPSPEKSGSEPNFRAFASYACSVARAPAGYTAAYAELWFKDAGYPRFPLATVVCIAARADGESPDC